MEDCNAVCRWLAAGRPADCPGARLPVHARLIAPDRDLMLGGTAGRARRRGVVAAAAAAALCAAPALAQQGHGAGLAEDDAYLVAVPRVAVQREALEPAA